MSFTRNYYTGYPGYSRECTIPKNRRTSKVTFKTPSPIKQDKRRKSKERSPRTKILKNISKEFKKPYSKKIRNKYARDIAEFVQALSPALIAALSIYLYTIYEHRDDNKNNLDKSSQNIL
jgi:hypothetical protein